MRKTYIYEYNFNFKQEFSIYNNIGKNNAMHKNYSEWVSYVQEKYGLQKYTKTSLINFLHYLIGLRNSIEIKKDSWTNGLLPLISVFLSIITTLIFSLLNIMHSFNITITSIYAGNVQEQFYDENFYADLLSETLSSDMGVYCLGVILLALLGIIIFSNITNKISLNKQKYYFYCDYIEIINKILD
ncbi:hypothetical protein D7Y41_18750 [Anaerotruncus sp. 1XD22-93]|nr:hypothetical protein [Lachnospiraceae bacterium]NBI76971.1 hypothetical protein [Lachnospiraceae bacterium]RKJ87066.1 hypothetical protein D7Y41_18750 [Anaerotruncus sp. 1XD22-93]